MKVESEGGGVEIGEDDTYEVEVTFISKCPCSHVREEDRDYVSKCEVKLNGKVLPYVVQVLFQPELKKRVYARIHFAGLNTSHTIDGEFRTTINGKEYRLVEMEDRE